MAEFHYNDKAHSATNYSPFFLTYGLHPWKGQITVNSLNPAVEDFTSELVKIQVEAKVVLEENNNKMTERFSDKRIKDKFKLGTRVC